MGWSQHVRHVRVAINHLGIATTAGSALANKHFDDMTRNQGRSELKAWRKKNEPLQLFQRRNGSQVGHDRAQVIVPHAAVPCESHGRLKLSTVAGNTLRDRALDLSIAPISKPLLRVRSDVCGGTSRPSRRKALHISSAELPPAFSQASLAVIGDPAFARRV